MRTLMLRKIGTKTDTYYFFHVVQEVTINTETGYHVTNVYAGRGMQMAISIWNMDKMTKIQESSYFVLQMPDEMYRDIIIFMKRANSRSVYKVDKHHYKFSLIPVEINGHYDDHTVRDLYKLPYDDVLTYGIKSER